MRSRSPSRHSPPPPPRISRRSPGGFRRGKSPDRRRRLPPSGMPKYIPGGRSGSPSRGRDRRELRHSPRRRSRSPFHREAKARSFSPGKRKDRGRSRERSRPSIPPPKRVRSKSPAGSVAGSTREGHLGPPGPYPPGPGSDAGRSNFVITSDRIHGTEGSYRKEPSNRPVFREAEGIDYDINEMKKIKVNISRPSIPFDSDSIQRRILNPEDVVIVRRYEEGRRPIFERDEIVRAPRTATSSEKTRVMDVVSDPPLHSQGSSQFESPGHYANTPRPRGEYYTREREPPHDYSRSSRDYERGPDFEQSERGREDRFERRSDDLRHELELRRRDNGRYSSLESRRYDREYRGDSDRESSRHRAVDRRSESPDRDRPHRSMMQPSPPGSERRREGFGRSGGDKISEGRMYHGGGPSHRDDGPDRLRGSPEFSSQRSEKFDYKNWDSNPEHVPKGRGYFEHDNRDTEFIRGRGRGIVRRGLDSRIRGIYRGRPFIRRGLPIPRMGIGRSGARRGFLPPRGFFHLRPRGLFFHKY